jgi:hypothetical protein
MMDPEIVWARTQAIESIMRYMPLNFPTDLFFEKSSTKISRVATSAFDEKKYNRNAGATIAIFLPKASRINEIKNNKLKYKVVFLLPRRMRTFSISSIRRIVITEETT